MTMKKQQRTRSEAAEKVRSRASETVDKALRQVSAPEEVKTRRREKLTSYPPLVTEARDRNKRGQAAES